MKYRLERSARTGIAEAWAYIAVDSVTAADLWLADIIRHFELLGEVPAMGRKRDEIRPGYHSFSAGNYLVFYRIAEPGVHIMHVVHGSRDLLHYPFAP